MLTKAISAFGAAASLLGFLSLNSTAVAQTSGSQAPPASGTTEPRTQGGTTSGPAAGSPTTMGTSGTTTGTPHQTETIRDPSSAVKREAEQGSQPGAAQGSGSVGTEQVPALPGSQSGPTPTPTQ
jgi:hypothetical protein